MNFNILCVVSYLIFALQKNFTSFGTKSLDRCQPAAPVESQHAHPRSSDDYLLLFIVYVWSFFFMFLLFLWLLSIQTFSKIISNNVKFFFFVSLNTFRGVGVCQYDSELIQQMSPQKQTPKNMPEHQRAR